MLTTLDLSCGSISSESVQEVARRCPRLDCLLLSRRSEMEIPSVAASARLVWTCGSKYLDQWACQQVSLESMKALAMGCTRLRSLDLSMCTQMTGEGVWHLMQHCSLLVNLDLSYCINAIDATALTALAESTCAAQLEAIDLTHTGPRSGNYDRIDELMSSKVSDLTQACPALRHFRLADNPWVSSDALAAIASGAECGPHLETLDVFGCFFLQEDRLIEVFGRCPRIRNLHLGGFGSRPLNRMRGNLANGRVMRAVAAGCPHIQQLHLMDALSNSCGDGESSHTTFSSALLELANRLHDLDRIDLTAVRHMARDTVTQLLDLRGERLTTLHLFDASPVDDEILVQIAQVCPNLRALDVSGCYDVKDPGVLAVSLGCRALHTLSINYCGPFRGETMCAVVGRLTKLRRLDAQCCCPDLVTQEGFSALVSAILDGCPDFRVFDVGWPDCLGVPDVVHGQKGKMAHVEWPRRAGWMTLAPYVSSWQHPIRLRVL